jgi:hypothetical protein
VEDIRSALINPDKMICEHLRTRHAYAFHSLARDSQLTEEQTQSGIDPSYASVPAAILKHATGRCSDPDCDTTYRLNWTFGFERIQLRVTRHIGKMPLRDGTYVWEGPPWQV